MLGPWNLEDDQTFLVLCLVLLVVVAAAVVQLRGGTFGRTLLALRGSKVGAESIGISTGKAHLLAFAVSGFIAGLGGALLAIQQGNVNYGTNFAPFAALFWLVLVVTLGMRSVDGAIIAAMSYALFDAVILKGAFLGWLFRDPDRIPAIFPISGEWRFVLFGLGAIQFARHPEGVIESPSAGGPSAAGRRPTGSTAAAHRTNPRPQRRRWWDDAILQVRHLTKRFAGILALDEVSIDLELGERVGLIGPNGAGKTTFFNCMLGVLPRRRRHASSSTARTSRPHGEQAGPHGHRSHVPADRAVPRRHRPRPPVHRRAGATRWRLALERPARAGPSPPRRDRPVRRGARAAAASSTSPRSRSSGSASASAGSSRSAAP